MYRSGSYTSKNKNDKSMGLIIVVAIILVTQFFFKDDSPTSPLPYSLDEYYNFDQALEGRKLLEVDGGDMNPERQPNVAVDIGFGDREYYGYTNEYGQLVMVLAEKIVPQEERTEPVINHRYYEDEARVKGTEKKEYGQGHVIADSLGGVANAYNITPQDHFVNTKGKQAEMEEFIRHAKGCEKFIGIITYPNHRTQIPSYYDFQFIINGKTHRFSFPNQREKSRL